jgi:glycosyltransferase involved in cell wall biosynthesis
MREVGSIAHYDIPRDRAVAPDDRPRPVGATFRPSIPLHLVNPADAAWAFPLPRTAFVGHDRRTMNRPAYSIVIPVYQRLLGFDEALRSALDVAGCGEIIVIDDGSSHREFEAMCAAAGDARIRYVRNETNLGLFANWNHGIDLARGEFVSVLCSDDLVCPDAFTRFRAALAVDPSIDVFFGAFCTFSRGVEDAVTLRAFPEGPMAWHDLLADAVRRGPGFPVLSVIRRSKALEFRFVDRPHSGNDWLWIYGNASSFRLYATRHPINYWRRHPDQDAALSQSITTDCWPLMYVQSARQLRSVGSPLAKLAMRRAKGVILSWLLNDHRARENHYPRLLDDGAKSNPFLAAVLDIVDQDWLLAGLLKDRANSSIHYNVGRVARKSGFYPPIFDRST